MNKLEKLLIKRKKLINKSKNLATKENEFSMSLLKKNYDALKEVNKELSKAVDELEKNKRVS